MIDTEAVLTEEQVEIVLASGRAAEFLAASAYLFSASDVAEITEIVLRYELLGLDAIPLLETILERFEDKYEPEQQFPLAFVQGAEELVFWVASEPCSIVGYIDTVADKFVDAIDGVDPDDEEEDDAEEDEDELVALIVIGDEAILVPLSELGEPDPHDEDEDIFGTSEAAVCPGCPECSPNLPVIAQVVNLLRSIELSEEEADELIHAVQQRERE